MRWTRLTIGGLTGVLMAGLSLAQPPRPSTPPEVPDQAAAGNQPAGDAAAELGPLLKQFVDVLSLVEQQAAQPPPVDKIFYEGAVPSMLRGLDPHTQFFQPSQFEQLREMEQSEQKGFGSIVSVLPGQVIFLQTFPGTPSNKAGISPGDSLVAVNNIAIGNLEADQIVQLLTAARQQKVTLFVRRSGDAKLLAFTLTPELVDSPSVDRAYMLAPGYGYIRVTAWDMQTAPQLKHAIDQLGGGKLRGLVLDLRNNPGGLVKASLDAAAMFLKPGQRILTAKGRFGEPEIANTPANAHPYGFRLAVLINAKTASASEILAGALQDHDRATIVGEPSYGKGLVQSVMPLSEGAGLALTTAFYYTPSGRSIQRPLRDSTLSATFSSGSAPSAPLFRTDAGRAVTGGGGIQPDLRVEPPEPTRLETVLDASGSITTFATSFLDRHSPLPQHFSVTPGMLDDFKVFLAQRNILPNISDWTRDRPWITSRLEQEIVMQARGVAAGDEIEARRDPQVQQALHAIESLLPAAGNSVE